MRKSYLKYIILSVTSISIDFGYQSILIGELNRWIRLISDIGFYRLTTSAILIFRLSDSRNAEEKFTKKKQRFPRVRSPLTPLTAALFHLNAWNELISWKHSRLFHMKLPPGGGELLCAFVTDEQGEFLIFWFKSGSSWIAKTIVLDIIPYSVETIRLNHRWRY